MTNGIHTNFWFADLVHGVGASEQTHMAVKQHQTGLTIAHNSINLYVYISMCFGSVQYQAIFSWFAYVPLDIGTNDSYDWLHQNDSYKRTFRTRSNTVVTNPNSVKPGIMKWLIIISCIPCDVHFFATTDGHSTMSPGSESKQKTREKDRIRFATMSIEKKDRRNAKKREKYSRTKREGPTISFNYKFIFSVE